MSGDNHRPQWGRTWGSLCVAAAALSWGLWPVWVRGGAGGDRAAAISFLVSGTLALPLALATRRRERRLPGDWGQLLLLGLVNGLNAYLYFRALDEAPVAPGAITHYLAPVLVALAAPALLKEPPSRRTPIALVLALGGTSALLIGRGGTGSTAHAVVLGGASALFYAASVILGKRITTRFSDAELFAGQALTAGIALVPLAGGLPADAGAWLMPAAGGVVSGLLGGLIYYVGLRRLPAERVGILTYLEVPSAVLVGWAAYGEAPGPMAALGGVLVVAAGILVITAPS